MTSPVAFGVLVGIEFRDVQNPPGSSTGETGGPHWLGVVDTDEDTLTIHFWDELPAFGPAFWQPDGSPDLSASPLVWSALRLDTTADPDLGGVPYDVPNDFGSGGQVTIGSDWGFVSDDYLTQMSWTDGEFTAQPGPFPTPGSDLRPGWGAYVGFNQAGEVELFASGDETELPFWPRDPGGTISVVDGALVTTFDPSPTAVPEATPGFILALLSIWQAFRRRRALRR